MLVRNGDVVPLARVEGDLLEEEGVAARLGRLVDGDAHEPVDDGGGAQADFLRAELDESQAREGQHLAVRVAELWLGHGGGAHVDLRGKVKPLGSNSVWPSVGTSRHA